MAKCMCLNDRHGHPSPCGREGTVGTDSLCAECHEKAAGEFEKTHEGRPQVCNPPQGPSTGQPMGGETKPPIAG